MCTTYLHRIVLERVLPVILFSGTQNQPKNELKASFKIRTHFNRIKKTHQIFEKLWIYCYT